MTKKIVISDVEITVEIVSSAFMHGKTADDILSGLASIVYDETLEEYPNKTLVVGFDSSANVIEIILNVISDESVIVFHAMDCRKVYRDKIIR